MINKIPKAQRMSQERNLGRRSCDKRVSYCSFPGQRVGREPQAFLRCCPIYLGHLVQVRALLERFCLYNALERPFLCVNVFFIPFTYFRE